MFSKYLFLKNTKFIVIIYKSCKHSYYKITYYITRNYIKLFVNFVILPQSTNIRCFSFFLCIQIYDVIFLINGICFKNKILIKM